MCYNKNYDQTFCVYGQHPGIIPEEEAETERLVEKAKAEGNPWAKAAGIFKDDPLFNEWVEIMRENRRKADEDPNY